MYIWKERKEMKEKKKPEAVHPVSRKGREY